jgi:putative FmdB family regulatory protein
MPIYEYECRKCGKGFEVIQKMDEGGEGLKCPSCGQKNPEKRMSCCSSFSKGSESASPSPAASCGGGHSHFS